LAWLEAHGQQVRELKPNKTFTNALSLEALMMNYNSIRILGGWTFNGAENLLQINLSYSQIEHLDAEAFRGLPKLQNLALDNNWIHQLPEYLFSRNMKLSFVDFTNNHIMRISREAFRPTNPTVHFKGNICINRNLRWIIYDYLKYCDYSLYENEIESLKSEISNLRWSLSGVSSRLNGHTGDIIRLSNDVHYLTQQVDAVIAKINGGSKISLSTVWVLYVVGSIIRQFCIEFLTEKGFK
jgi:hypothetical protein